MVKWVVTRHFFRHSETKKQFETFIVVDEQGVQVTSANSIEIAVRRALFIAAMRNRAVEIVG